MSQTEIFSVDVATVHDEQYWTNSNKVWGKKHPGGCHDCPYQIEGGAENPQIALPNGDTYSYELLRKLRKELDLALMPAGECLELGPCVQEVAGHLQTL